MSSILLKANGTTEKASFISKKSTSSVVIFANFNALGAAFVGAVVNHCGACAVSAKDKILAIGFKSYFLTASALARTNAEAPSLIVEALAAVTVPSLENAALS